MSGIRSPTLSLAFSRFCSFPQSMFFSSTTTSPASPAFPSSSIKGIYGPIPEISSEDAKKQLKSFCAILDVRNPDELSAGVVSGSKNIPLPDLLVGVQSNAIQQLRGLGPVLVYCKAGRRSAQATEALRKSGIEAVSMSGGYNAFKDTK